MGMSLFSFWQNFHEIDTNRDGYISPEEIYDIKYDDLGRLLGSMGEEEEGEGEEDVDNSERMVEGNAQPEDSSSDTTDEIHVADSDSKLDREHIEL